MDLFLQLLKFFFSFVFWKFQQTRYCNLGSLVASIVTDSLSIFLIYFSSQSLGWEWKHFDHLDLNYFHSYSLSFLCVCGRIMLFNGLPSPERAFCRKPKFSFHYIRHELELGWKGENAYIECLDIYAYYFHSESFSIFLYYMQTIFI